MNFNLIYIWINILFALNELNATHDSWVFTLKLERTDGLEEYSRFDRIRITSTDQENASNLTADLVWKNEDNNLFIINKYVITKDNTISKLLQTDRYEKLLVLGSYKDDIKNDQSPLRRVYFDTVKKLDDDYRVELRRKVYTKKQLIWFYDNKLKPFIEKNRNYFKENCNETLISTNYCIFSNATLCKLQLLKYLSFAEEIFERIAELSATTFFRLDQYSNVEIDYPLNLIEIEGDILLDCFLEVLNLISKIRGKKFNLDFNPKFPIKTFIGDFQRCVIYDLVQKGKICDHEKSVLVVTDDEDRNIELSKDEYVVFDNKVAILSKYLPTSVKNVTLVDKSSLKLPSFE